MTTATPTDTPFASPPIPPTPAPLGELTVLELGQLIAGPFAAKTLADFGAQVLKIESPHTGDPLRQWRVLHEGTSLWWQVQSRNKQSLSMDLRHPKAQMIVKQLIPQTDILIENFRPGTLEEWGLGPEELQKINPRLIVLRISGYGQTGPYKDKPGFGVIAEAMGGLRHLTAEPSRVPVRVGVSIGDTLAALHGVIGVLIALHERERSGKGQVIDVALYEAVFNCMESLLPEYSAKGLVREAAGSALPGIAPTNAYRCLEDRYALIAGNGDSIYKRLMSAIGRDDLGQDPELAHNTGRVKRVEEIDAAIQEWSQTRTVSDVLETLERAQVPAGQIYNIADIAQDPHYRARGMLQSLTLQDGTTFEVPGIVPKLSRTPGAHAHLAPQLGEHTLQTLTALGLNAIQIQGLLDQGIIAVPKEPSTMAPR